MKLLICLALICSGLSFSAMAKTKGSGSSSSGGVLIVQTIAGGVHRYAVRLPKCGQTYSHFKIVVSGGAMQVSSAGLKYANGQSNQYGYSGTFDAGYVSSWIAFDNFRSSTDCVTQMFVEAQSVDPKHPARLTLYGQ
jgi:hypothetical protein